MNDDKFIGGQHAMPADKRIERPCHVMTMVQVLGQRDFKAVGRAGVDFYVAFLSLVQKISSPFGSGPLLLRWGNIIQNVMVKVNANWLQSRGIMREKGT
ncbi:hypothetical protein GCM10027594_00300 [Hymenobacter agri]